MELGELIDKLKGYNPKAKVDVIVHNRSENFTITYGGWDSVTKEIAPEVSFYVDRLCGNEEESK